MKVWTFFIVFSIILPLIAAQDCKCGQPSQKARVKRVTGGRDAQKGAHPWMASLVRFMKNENDFTQPYCGGALISNRYILTAGHCIYNRSEENTRVLLNFYDTNDFDENKHVHRINKFLLHPAYVDDLKHPQQDIGLIRLEKELQFDDEVSPICLPSIKPFNDNDTFYGFLTTVGWGRLSRKGELPDHLQEVKIPQDVDVCSLVYGEKFLDSHICLKDTRKIKKDWKDVCKGDSGSPLLMRVNQRYRIYGVTSFGNCLGIPAAVFTKVRVYLNWIKEQIKDSNFCMIE